MIEEKGYAKINLFLDIENKRADGFHNIKSVMHSLSLCDIIKVEKVDSENNITIEIENCDSLKCDSSNLVYRATELFLKEAKIKDSIHIVLQKNIPICAGLGGGSTDAGATLRALNRLFDNPIDKETMLSIGEKLGSDVPYCIVGGTCICTGKGEQIEILPNNKHLYCVIAKSDEVVSTPHAYSKLDKKYNDFRLKNLRESNFYFKQLTKSIVDEGELSGLYNIFEEVILDDCKIAKELKKEMLKLGAKHSLMSGSGPSVFGIFETANDAKLATKALKEKCGNVFYCETV